MCWLERRMRNVLTVFAVALVVLTACNFPQISSVSTDTGPRVTILSPTNGAQVEAGVPVTLQVNATHAKGVIRVEIKVDGALVNTSQSQNAGGQPSMDAVQTWTFGQAGSHVVSAQAFDAAGRAGDAVAVSVLVTGSQTVAATPTLATGTQGVAQTPGGCDLITTAEAEATLGEPVALAQTQAGGCAFNSVPDGLHAVSVGAAQGADAAQLLQNATLVLGMAGLPLDQNQVQQFQNLAAAQDFPGYFQELVTSSQGTPVKSQLLEGPNKKGYWAWVVAGERRQGLLLVARGSLLVNVNLVVGADRQETAMLAAASTLAETIFGRIPADLVSVVPGVPTPTVPPPATATQPSGQVQQVPLPTIALFVIVPNTVTLGTPATMQWQVNNADVIQIDQGIGNVATSGSVQLTPGSTTTYHMLASNAGGQVTAEATLNIVPPTAAVIKSFTADPTTIKSGEESTLKWEVTGATNILIDNGIGPVASTGSLKVKPTETTTYKMYATGEAGGVTAEVKVEISTGLDIQQIPHLELHLGPMWHDWEKLGGQFTYGPTVASWSKDRLDVFVRGTNSHLMHKWWDGSQWKGWEDLGGELADAPACVSWGPNRIDCFVHGMDNELWHKWWNGSQWSGWEKLGGVFQNAPTVASWAANRLDVFVRGTNTHLMHKWWDGSQWSGWEDLGGVLNDGPGCVSWAANRIDCFVRGSDQELWHKWWNGSQWSGWEKLGGAFTGAPTVASWDNNRLDVFVRGTNGALMHKWWDGSQWSGWENLAGVLNNSPGCVSWDKGRIDCFVQGSDNELWHKWFE